MSRWFRFYDDAINDPKILKLPEATRWHWTAILCIASKNNGVLPPIADVAVLLRMSQQKAAAVLTTLANAQLLDRDETGFHPHNWDKRQYKSDVSNERVKRHRQRHRNDECNVTVTPPDTEDRNREQNTEKKETRASALVVDDGWPEDFREQFWLAYPNKVGKPKALAKLEAVRKRAATVPFDEIMAGLDAYIRSKPPDRAWLNPETFINQERWADRPAPISQVENGSHQPKPGSVPAAFREIRQQLESDARRSGEAGGNPVLRLSSG